MHQLRFLQSLTLDSISWAAATAPEAATSLQPSSGILFFGVLIRLSSTQGAAPPPSDALSSLTALTRLDLWGKSVALGGLSALTGLKELRCQGTARYEGNPGMTLDDMPDLGRPPDIRQDMLAVVQADAEAWVARTGCCQGWRFVLGCLRVPCRPC